MAEGLQKITGADIALCTTGIAGPTGGSENKPVGLIYIGLRFNNITTVREVKLSSDLPRIQMKEEFVNQALNFALSILTTDRI